MEYGPGRRQSGVTTRPRRRRPCDSWLATGERDAAYCVYVVFEAFVSDGSPGPESGPSRHWWAESPLQSQARRGSSVNGPGTGSRSDPWMTLARGSALLSWALLGGQVDPALSVLPPRAPLCLAFRHPPLLRGHLSYRLLLRPGPYSSSASEYWGGALPCDSTIRGYRCLATAGATPMRRTSCISSSP